MLNTFQLVQTLYWLALSTWFGGVLFVALSAPIIFRTIRTMRPILPSVLSVNLENEHGALLAGEVVANILRMLSIVQVVCAAVLLLMLICQWFVMGWTEANIWSAAIRATAFAGAAVLVVYDRYVVWPKALHFRQEYVEHADEPEVANPAKEEFDRYHQESVKMLTILLALLSLMVVFGGGVTPW